MSNFLHNLLARSLGRADVVQPLIAPRFASTIVGAPDVAEVVSSSAPPQGVVQQGDHEQHRAHFVQPPVDPQTADRPAGVPPNAQAPQPQTVQARSNDQQQAAPAVHFVQPAASPAPLRSDKTAQPAPQLISAIVPAQAVNDPGASSAIEGSRPVRESARVGSITPGPPIEGRIASAVERVRAAQNRAAAAHPHTAPAAPTIQITIGRIEVRATQPPAAPQRRAAASSAAMSLDDYLRGRNGGGR